MVRILVVVPERVVRDEVMAREHLRLCLADHSEADDPDPHESSGSSSLIVSDSKSSPRGPRVNTRHSLSTSAFHACGVPGGWTTISPGAIAARRFPVATSNSAHGDKGPLRPSHRGSGCPESRPWLS